MKVDAAIVRCPQTVSLYSWLLSCVLNYFLFNAINIKYTFNIASMSSSFSSFMVHTINIYM